MRCGCGMQKSKDENLTQEITGRKRHRVHRDENRKERWGCYEGFGKS